MVVPDFRKFTFWEKENKFMYIPKHFYLGRKTYMHWSRKLYAQVLFGKAENRYYRSPTLRQKMFLNDV